MPRPNQSICLNMIVRNEAHVVRRCLDSVRPFIDAWVVVDTGSTDGTQEMVREALRGIPGELFERPWKDFAHNRSEAIELARGRADYLFFIDADEVVFRDEGFEFPELSLDSYMLQMRLLRTHYSRRQLVRSSLPWAYRGVLHEYVHCDDAKTEGAIDGIHTRAHTDGARAKDPRKYRRDALVLEQALLEEPDNARHVFYLAQCYRDDGDRETAVLHYQRRVELGGWVQEVWFSLYQIALLHEQMGRPWSQVSEEYLKAFQLLPTRAEPLYRLGLHYQLEQAHAVAHLYFSKAAAIPYPAGDTLFIDDEILRCRLPLEHAVSLHYAGEVEAAVRTNQRLLAEGLLTPSLHDLVEQNQVYSEGALRFGFPRSRDRPGVHVCFFGEGPDADFAEAVESLQAQSQRPASVAVFTTESEPPALPDGVRRFLCGGRDGMREELRAHVAATCSDDDVVVLLQGSERIEKDLALALLAEAFAATGCDALAGSRRDSATRRAGPGGAAAPSTGIHTPFAARAKLFAGDRFACADGEGPRLAVDSLDCRVDERFVVSRGSSDCGPTSVPPFHGERSPRVGCYMITKDRVHLARRAIRSFAEQAWPERELVIVSDGEPHAFDALQRFVDRRPSADVRLIRPPEVGWTLGRLRNFAVDACDADYVCQWDDDDWSHPARIQTQFARLTESGSHACCLAENLQLFASTGVVALLDWSAAQGHPPVHPGTLLMKRDSRFRYPEEGPQARTGEDSALLDALVRHGPVARVSGAGHLYVYRFHGRNSFSKGHHQGISRFAASRERHLACEPRIREAVAGAGLPLPVAVVGCDGLAFRIE